MVREGCCRVKADEPIADCADSFVDLLDLIAERFVGGYQSGEFDAVKRHWHAFLRSG